MNEITEEEKAIMMQIEVLDEEILLIEGMFIEAEEVKQELKFPKTLLYFSDAIFVYKFIYKEDPPVESGYDLEPIEYNILQLYDRDEKRSKYYYCADPKLERSLLLNIINRGEQFGVKKGYL